MFKLSLQIGSYRAYFFPTRGVGFTGFSLFLSFFHHVVVYSSFITSFFRTIFLSHQNVKSFILTCDTKVRETFSPKAKVPRLGHKLPIDQLEFKHNRIYNNPPESKQDSCNPILPYENRPSAPTNKGNLRQNAISTPLS